MMSNPSDRIDFSQTKFVVAPMVDQSELAWRLLARRYGAQLCFTPMYNANVLVNNPVYRQKVFDDISCSEDRPLVVQFCANTVDLFLKAAQIVEPYCDAVDLNLGCPQHIAKRGRFGAFLQDNWDLLRKMISVCSEGISIPVTAKIRVFPEVKKTVEYAEMLESAGCKLITVHGRTKEQRGRYSSLASWQHVTAIKRSLSIPVFSNGNIRTLDDIHLCLGETNADGVVVAESHLANPCIFEGRNPPVFEIVKEYLDLVREHPCPISYVRGHLFRLWVHTLKVYPEYQEILGRARTLEQMYQINEEIHARCLKEDEEIYDQPETSLEFPHWICQPYIREQHKLKKNKETEHNEKNEERGDACIISRNQRRRLAKYQRKMEGLKLKREAERKRRKERKLKKKAEEGDNELECSFNINSTSNLAKERINASLLDALDKEKRTLKVCIDLTWTLSMNDKEISKLAGQLGRLYGSNRKSKNPAGLFFSGFSTESQLYKECSRKHSGFENYKILMSEKSYEQIFPDQELVYLSPDADTELEDTCSGEVYILGGLVDETVRLQLTRESALEQGIKCRRLPIQSHMHRSGHHSNYSTVLAINQVFDVLLTYNSTKDWKTALVAGMPPRKGFVINSEDK